MINGLKFVVTGIGRSGTRFLANVFNAGGVKCGHEDILHQRISHAAEADSRDYVGDSSFFSAPLVAELPAGVSVIHLVRHPLNWMRSWASFKFLVGATTATDTWVFVLRHMPGLMDIEHPWSRLAHLWIRWNGFAELVSENVEYSRIRLEDVNYELARGLVEKFGGSLSEEQFMAIKDRNASSHPKPDIDLGEIRGVEPTIYRNLVESAERYGYAI